MAFRPELEDFGAFYERTDQVAFRTALAIVRDAALAADVTPIDRAWRPRRLVRFPSSARQAGRSQRVPDRCFSTRAAVTDHWTDRTLPRSPRRRHEPVAAPDARQACT
jgi:hypothetical protein